MSNLHNAITKTRINIFLYFIKVRVGKKLRFNVGYLQYDVLSTYSFSPEAIAGAVTSALCIIIIFFIILFLYRRKSTQAEREYKRIQIQMDTLESNVRSECKQGSYTFSIIL